MPPRKKRRWNGWWSDTTERKIYWQPGDDHPNPDPEYIRDLKARLRTHKNDLIYRGRDVEGQLQDDGITELHHRDLL